MKHFMLMLLCVVHLCTHADVSKPPILTLTKKNTLVLRGVVNSESVTALELQLLEMSDKLKKTDTIYLVLDTPGGSVYSGLELIDTIHGIPQKVKTVTVFAASMGFQIAQNLDERLILPSGTLMSHRASISGMSGELNGELNTRLNHIMKVIARMDKIAAKRMSLSNKKYQDMIHDELWMDGEQSVELKAADRVVLARCDSTFAGTSRVELGRIFDYVITGEMSNCPLVTGAMNIRVEQTTTEEKIDEAKDLMASIKRGKADVVKRYMCTGKLL